MRFSSKGLIRLFNSRLMTLLAAVLLSAAPAFAQEADDETIISGGSERVEPGTGPWNNGSTSTRGRDNNSDEETTPAAVGSQRPATSNPLARPSGSTGDGRDPAGNPDVPFDDNMNLAFLAGALVFAFVVYRRRHNLSTVSFRK